MRFGRCVKEKTENLNFLAKCQWDLASPSLCSSLFFISLGNICYYLAEKLSPVICDYFVSS